MKKSMSLAAVCLALTQAFCFHGAGSGSAALAPGGLRTVQMERNTEIQIPAEADAASVSKSR